MSTSNWGSGGLVFNKTNITAGNFASGQATYEGDEFTNEYSRAIFHCAWVRGSGASTAAVVPKLKKPDGTFDSVIFDNFTTALGWGTLSTNVDTWVPVAWASATNYLQWTLPKGVWRFDATIAGADPTATTSLIIIHHGWDA
jgi:hypothetical protein